MAQSYWTRPNQNWLLSFYLVEMKFIRMILIYPSTSDEIWTRKNLICFWKKPIIGRKRRVVFSYAFLSKNIFHIYIFKWIKFNISAVDKCTQNSYIFCVRLKISITYFSSNIGFSVFFKNLVRLVSPNLWPVG